MRLIVLLSLFTRLFALPTNITHPPEAVVYPTLFTGLPSTHSRSHPRPYSHSDFLSHSYSYDHAHTPQLTPTITLPLGTLPLTRSPPPFPTHTPPPDPRLQRSRTHQTPILIFFEGLSGLAGLALVLGLLRCFNSYRKTPPRDRISDILQRHRLQVEMEELQRRPPARTLFSQEPAPPYIPRPPSYVETPSGALQYVPVPYTLPSDYPSNLPIHHTDHAPGRDAG